MTVKVGLCGFTMAASRYPLHFPVVEVQQTFYEPPKLDALDRWRTAMPPAFELTIKAWQLITHTVKSPTYRQLRRVLNDAERAGGLAAKYLDEHARLEFNIPGVTFGGRYDGSPVIVGDGSVPPADEPNAYVPTASPGGRPPHAWLDDGRSLFDLFHSEWTLLLLDPDAAASTGFEDAARVLALNLRVVRLPQMALQALYEAPLVLIRPDHIVAWRGTSANGAADVLARVSGR